MAHAITATHTGTSISDRFWAFVGNVRQARAKATEYNRTYSELQSLSTRELDDIGLRRCDIGDIARIHVYGN
ncbi:MAG: DUF1127 domain-containing protein [Ruegeria sp.]